MDPVWHGSHDPHSSPIMTFRIYVSDLLQTRRATFAMVPAFNPNLTELAAPGMLDFAGT